jgi:cysteine-rich repeat protein
MSDSTASDSGTLNAWRIALCVVPTLCGDGVVDAGEACDDGNNATGDGCNATCAIEAAYTCSGSPSVCVPNCGNGVINAGETCDDANILSGDGCSAACAIEANYTCVGTPSVCTPNCGNGVVNVNETCDDANQIPDDGCNACSLDPTFSCSGTPQVCMPLPVESKCNDGADDDGDGMIDCADSDCAFGCGLATQCTAGQLLYVYTSKNVPKAVPDNLATGVTSIVTVLPSATIQRVAARINFTHTWDSDLDISLKSPAGPFIDLTSGNGSSGDNYTNTVLDSLCASPVTGGVAPFTGCFAPEQSLTAFNGQSMKGIWTLKAVDHATGDTGTLTGWAIALCVTP